MSIAEMIAWGFLTLIVVVIMTALVLGLIASLGIALSVWSLIGAVGFSLAVVWAMYVVLS